MTKQTQGTLLPAASTASLVFQNTTFNIVDRDGAQWLKSQEIAVALGYADEKSVNRIFARNSDEFTDKMTTVVNLTTVKNTSGVNLTPVTGEKEMRIFSLRGAHLLAMFARTEIAKQFRKWILDLIETVGQIDRAPYSVNPDDALSAAQAEQLRMLVKIECEKLPKDFRAAFNIKVWSRLKAHFGVTYRKIPQREFAEALSLVGRHAAEYPQVAPQAAASRDVRFNPEDPAALRAIIKLVPRDFLPTVLDAVNARMPANHGDISNPEYYRECRAELFKFADSLPSGTQWPADEATRQKIADGYLTDILMGRRWLMSFGCDGRLETTPVERGACVIHPGNATSLATLISEFVPLQLLPKVIDSANCRIAHNLDRFIEGKSA